MSSKRKFGSAFPSSTISKPKYRPKSKKQGLAMRARRLELRSGREAGYVDVGLTNYNLDSTGSLALLNTVPQGASTSQRVGKKILLKSLLMRGFAYTGTTAGAQDVAWMIVYDRRPTGSLPAITDVLTAAAPTAFMNDNNTTRFIVLKRCHEVMLGNTTTPATGGEAIEADFYLPLRGLPQIFKSAGTGAIADIEEGALYLITVGNRPAGTTAATLSASFRVRYVDV